MSTAEQIIADVLGEHGTRAYVAAHVVAALTNAGHGIYPEQYVGELRRIEADIEEWANYRVQDFDCKNAKDVLDIINREGEWADDEAAARVAEGGDQP